MTKRTELQTMELIDQLLAGTVDVIEQPRTTADRLMDVGVGAGIALTAFAVANVIAPKVGEYDDPEANRGMLSARTALGATVGFIGGCMGASRALNAFNDTELVFVQKKKSTRKSA